MDFNLPELGEGVYEAEFVRWMIRPGDIVKSGQNLCEVMTDKATMEVPAPFAGTVNSLHAEPGQRLKIGDRLLSYTPTGQLNDTQSPERKRRDAGSVAYAPGSEGPESNRLAAPVTAPVAPAARITSSPSHVKAAPSVRYMARKLGIDLGQVRGSGPQGRVLIEDLASQVPAVTPEHKAAPAAPPPDYGKPGTRLKLQGLRRAIAEHMVRAKRTIPHYSYIDECDVTDLVRLREQLRESFAASSRGGEGGVRLTFLAFFVKAVVAALKEVPIVNASLDEEAGEIVLHDHYHIGIAVATPGGLIVPVVHDADRKDLVEIAREIERLSTATRNGKVRREELRGGTFTVTSIGNVGGLISTPVINHPEVAILGVGKIVKRPIFDEQGQVKPADMVYLSLSFDHRVVDGAVGAAFCNAIIRQLESPALLLLPPR
jgi:pyruvate dehydrogenase E2 component (dihydrolipoamide acetyltransferase)/2-oxoisovalerate dehydrogenase E2 component (dihydrolipoyl transacylase)